MINIIYFKSDININKNNNYFLLKIEKNFAFNYFIMRDVFGWYSDLIFINIRFIL